MNSSYKKQDLQWRRRPEAKIKATQREFSQLSELQKGVSKKGLLKKNSKMSIADLLENAKQRRSALTSDLKRYTREGETRRIFQAGKTYEKGRHHK